VPLAQATKIRSLNFALGINPYRAFEPEYRGFCDLVAGNVATAIANARVFEETNELKHWQNWIAKTSFFSNISHEFRTPLTADVVTARTNINGIR